MSLLDAVWRSASSAAIALTDGASRLSYRELQQLVAQECSWLQVQGVRRCALFADNGIAWAIADLALLEGALVNVPLPGYFTAAQCEHVLSDAGVDAVLTDQPQRLQAHGFEPRAVSGASGLTLLSRHVAGVQPLPPHTIKVTYTSGSTADPKGVCLSAAVLERVSMSLRDTLQRLELARHFCVLPLATLLENIAGLYVPLLLGIESQLLPQATTGMSYGKLNAAALLRAIGAAQPTHLLLVPELLRLLVHAAQQGWQPPGSLKYIAVGGASVSASLLQDARALDLPVYEGYGLSECASVVCLNLPWADRPGSVGRPLPHARVRLAADGELHVGGPAMAGYLGLPLADEEIATGDLGHIDADGFVHVRGRAKNLFITSMGRNVAPEWVERELLREPAIAQAMAFGEAKPFVVALLNPSAPTVTHTELQRAVASANQRLPDYAQVRRWAVFPEAPTLASGLATANGRLKRAVILERHGAQLEALYSLENDIDLVS
jgi:long-chain acyl-CoA synthetase